MTVLTDGVLEEGIPADLAFPVREIFTGGDRLHRAPAPGAGYRLLNTYGPAEYTVTSTAVAVPPEGTGRPLPTIGRPIDNTAIYLLDRQGRPLPVGVPGELVVGGVGVGRGYLRRPALTAERFLPDAFAGAPGARFYRTGDLVRRLPDGDLDFLGRLDHQIKLRGFRIELGEIESVLTQHEAVREAVVLVRGRPGAERLAAYLVPAGERQPPAEELRGFLAERLPDYMVPAAFVALARLPLTPNGKVDRAALPEPEWSAGAGYLAPRTALEEGLAGIWQELLGVERVGVRDHFWDLGGHSLLATRLIARVRASFGVDVPLRSLFGTATIEEQAELVLTLQVAAQADDDLDALLADLEAMPEEAVEEGFDRH
jgi:acyl-CoA synthetase (AMP-forming)/AMP-acid ligase II